MHDWSKPAKKYGEMCAETGQLMGYGKDGFPILKRAEHRQQWRDWYAYYVWRGLKASQDLMRQKDEKTVPTLSPFDFDPEYNPKYAAPEAPRDGGADKAPLTAEQLDRHRRLYPFLRHFGEPNQPTRDAAE